MLSILVSVCGIQEVELITSIAAHHTSSYAYLQQSPRCSHSHYKHATCYSDKQMCCWQAASLYLDYMHLGLAVQLLHVQGLTPTVNTYMCQWQSTMLAMHAEPQALPIVPCLAPV